MEKTGQKKILVIEDEVVVSQPLAKRLESAGYDVHVEAFGKTGLQHAADSKPDLVVLDIKLPDISGYEVCKKLRELYNNSALPIVMLTCMTEAIDQVRGFTQGADAYLTKPYDANELLKTISVLLIKGVRK